MEKNATTTITIDLEVREKIESEKIHKNESNNDVLRKKYGLKVK